MSTEPSYPDVGLVHNGSFEDDTTPWRFFTNGSGQFDLSDQPAECRTAASVQIEPGGSNVQLYQRALSLAANTAYRLTFVAYSESGNDLGVYLHNHLAPYENYDLRLNQVNLTTGPQRYTVEFTTRNFSGSVDNARLRFWLAPFAQTGDRYLIDDVRLERRDGSESPLPAEVTAQSVTVTAAGLLLGLDESTFDPSVLETVDEGNIVDSDSAILETFLPLINQEEE